MSAAAILSAAGMVEVVCARCAMAFGVPVRFEADRRRDHATFYCPSGHDLIFKGKSDEEKLRDELAERDRRLAAKQASLEIEQRKTEQARNSARAYKGKLTEAKNRIKNGVCPCCRRHFGNLHRHMTTQHPTYGKEQT
jgi:outer membrane murein-binding lipoprotein Lpp